MTDCKEGFSICAYIRSVLPESTARDAMQLSPLALAYIGDCIYDLYVRTLLLTTRDFTAHKLHIHAAQLVNASAQAEASRRVLPLLGERELAVYKRARNAHMGTTARHATIADYRAATGLEAVIGYLYLQGQDERVRELMAAALETTGNRDGKEGTKDDQL